MNFKVFVDFSKLNLYKYLLIYCIWNKFKDK